jgi:hypothetical protein
VRIDTWTVKHDKGRQSRRTIATRTKKRRSQWSGLYMTYDRQNVILNSLIHCEPVKTLKKRCDEICKLGNSTISGIQNKPQTIDKFEQKKVQYEGVRCMKQFQNE